MELAAFVLACIAAACSLGERTPVGTLLSVAVILALWTPVIG